MIGLAYRCVWRKVRAILPLLPLVALAWGLALVVYQGDQGAWASPLFQSPVQPEVPPTRPAPEKVLPPTVQRPTPAPIPSPTPPPPPPTQPPVQPVQQVEPIVPPPDQPAPVQQPTLPPPAEQQAQPQPPAPPPPPAQDSSAPPEIVIDSGLLIDSILVYISYAWLCCGVLAFILIPVIFLALYVLGIRRAKNSEE